ncbi:MAG: hypothetical protein WCK11_01040 [Candidatus Falkowbacteria bacterium]
MELPFYFYTWRSITLNKANILQRILPHGHDAVWIDGIISVVGETPTQSLTTVRYLREEQTHFQGHFPTTPICRGTDMLEMANQTAACLYFILNDGVMEKRPEINMYEKIRFRQKAYPGQTLLIKCFNPKNERRAFRCDVEITIHCPEKPIVVATIEGLGGLKC